ncbi:Ger(x)C family spore germination C-terminal domain-containing protein [Ruminococcus sp.]|uniref:Ger(x)C family spore germination protein n=1 Tax=Ruminococcus sp. TaxID=41978 RepID=UPI0025E0C459|nr:Ger(x)C family spore germination C-terminal domain-containing protein [Ruminococcus sp.]MBQ8965801.1 hypothetical protein [Ruminococcus sp.]
MKQSRIVYLIVITVLACIIGSSFGRSVSIDRRGLVHAMGIDRTDSGYQVTLQIFRTGGGGADTAVDVSKPNVTCAVCEGKTVGEALANARSATGKELFFGHLQLICIGGGTPLDDPAELFAFALGDKNISPAVSLCMAENTASEVMEQRLSDKMTSAEALTSLLDVSCEYSDTLSCDLKELLGAEGCAAMPVLRVRTPDNSEESSDSEEDSTDISESLELAGTAVIEADRVLDKDEALAAAMLSGKADKGFAVTDIKGEKVTCELEDIKCVKRLYLAENTLHMKSTVTLVARADLPLDSDEALLLGEELSRKLTDSCSRFQKEMLYNNTDIFGITQLIKHRCPQIWLDYGSEVLDDIGAECEIKVRVA